MMLPFKSVARTVSAGYPAWKISPWLRSVPAAGGCTTVKVGEFRYDGRDPVVNDSGAETIPLSRTYRIT